MIDLLFALAVSASTYRTPHALALTDVVSAVSALHQRDWYTVTPEDVETLLPTTWERLSTQVPADSTYRRSQCDGSMYLRHEANGLTFVALFAKTERSPDCGIRLLSLRLEAQVPRAEANATRAALLSSLAAAGPVCGDVERYRWRNDSSTVVYDLSVATANEKGEPVFEMQLRHTAMPREALDDLPFRKGYFPPSLR